MSEEKIKVESLDIIVTMIDGKPYYEIKYKEVGKRHYNIGYSSYDLDFVLEWKEKWFEVVENKVAKDTHVPGKWIPCSARIPEYPKENPVFDGKHLEMYLVTINCGISNLDKVYPFRAFWNGINFTDGWEILDVIAWMPLPEPYRENDDEGQANT